MLKNWIQSTSHKVQNSISHTPEGTNTANVPLKDVARNTINKAHGASARSNEICTTPVALGGGVRVPILPTGVSWVLEL
jgi:hypothetical protein